MTQVGGVLKSIAKDFNIAVLVRIAAMVAPAGLFAALRCQVQTKLPTSGDQPRHEGRGRRGAARPGDVVESRSQNQDPAGAGGRGRAGQLRRAALCNADQVLQTGTEIQTDPLSSVLLLPPPQQAPAVRWSQPRLAPVQCVTR